MEEIRAQKAWNNCAICSVVSGVMGGGLGFFMGMFLGAFDNPIMQKEMTGADAPFCPSYLFRFNWTLGPFMSRFEFGPRT